MGKNKSSLSKAQSYAEIGEFWDSHDLTECWEQTRPAEFEVDIRSEVTYYALENTLAAEVRALAERRGVAPETLLNLWVREKLHQAETQR
jgi:CopG antitoxin of type II toxin-antitoxin system